MAGPRGWLRHVSPGFSAFGESCQLVCIFCTNEDDGAPGSGYGTRARTSVGKGMEWPYSTKNSTRARIVSFRPAGPLAPAGE
jgi:hypothetical protein